MRSKSMFLMIACVCGAIAAVGASQLMQAQGTSADPMSTTEILVATRVINQSEEIRADMMALESWPTDRVPPGSTSDLTTLQGQLAAQKIYPGEPIITEKLMNADSDMTVAIPKGFSVVSMKADPATGVGTLVRPGDRVNIMAYFTKSDLIPETGVRTVLTGIKVFAVDGRTARTNLDATAAPANTVSLLISNDDEEAWTLASELGRIRLSLGRPGETDEVTGSGGKQFVKWLADYQASRAEAIEAGQLPADQGNASAAKSSGFKMLKLHGGQWTEYEFVNGQKTPVIRNTSGGETIDATAEADGAEPQPDFNFLNGDSSPFYQPNQPTSGLPVPPTPGAGASGSDSRAGSY